MIFKTFTPVLMFILMSTNPMVNLPHKDRCQEDSTNLKMEVNQSNCHSSDSLIVIIYNHSNDTIKGNLVSIIKTINGNYVYLFDVKNRESYKKNFVAKADLILPHDKIKIVVPACYLIDANSQDSDLVRTILSFRKFTRTAVEYASSNEIVIRK